MASLSEAFDDVLPKGWANMFAPPNLSKEEIEHRKEIAGEQQRKRDELLLATFGFPFSELRPNSPPMSRSAMHYTRNNGEKYRFVYFSTKGQRWERE